MELKQFVSQQMEQDDVLSKVVAMIRPLPANVVPSEGFRAETRLRLLELDPAPKHATPRAA